MNFFNTQTVQKPQTQNQPTIVEQSDEFHKFKFLKWNRDIVDANIKDLTRKLKKKGQLDPGKVDEQNYIMEGQHRFLVCRDLGIPFSFLRVKRSETDIIELNTARSNWIIKDFLKYYRENHFNEYLKFDNLVNEFPELTISALLKAVYVTPKQFREGNMVITKEVFMNAQQLLTIIERQLNWFQGKNVFSFINAICSLNARPEFDILIFVAKANKYKGKIYMCSSVAEYSRMIKKLYNFNNRKKIL
jgi:hypothetical protein